MLYGYIRVSTDKQNVNNQRLEIQKFKERKNLPGKIEWIEETVSGTKGYEKRILGQVITDMTSGDVLMVSELSRLGRSLYHVMTLLNELMNKNVKVYSVKEGFILGDDINSKVMAFAFSLSAEIERTEDLPAGIRDTSLHFFIYRIKSINSPTGNCRNAKRPIPLKKYPLF